MRCDHVGGRSQRRGGTMRRAILFLILVWASGAAQASDVITPRIDTMLRAVPPRWPSASNATGTTHSNASINTNRFHELVYLWNYDDPDSGTWATTGKSRNHMSGPLGAHVFEPSSFPDCGGHCKEYNVELTVKDTLKGYVVKPTKITVYNPDDSTNGWGAAGRSICISRRGTSRDAWLLPTRGLTSVHVQLDPEQQDRCRIPAASCSAGRNMELFVSDSFRQMAKG